MFPLFGELLIYQLVAFSCLKTQSQYWEKLLNSPRPSRVYDSDQSLMLSIQNFQSTKKKELITLNYVTLGIMMILDKLIISPVLGCRELLGRDKSYILS